MRVNTISKLDVGKQAAAAAAAAARSSGGGAAQRTAVRTAAVMRGRAPSTTHQPALPSAAANPAPAPPPGVAAAVAPAAVTAERAAVVVAESWTEAQAGQAERHGWSAVAKLFGPSFLVTVPDGPSADRFAAAVDAAIASTAGAPVLVAANATSRGSPAAADDSSGSGSATKPEAAAGAAAAVPGPVLADGRVYYFAYGANMAPDVLARRGVAPLAPGDAAMAADARLRIRFKHRGGYATLEPQPQPPPPQQQQQQGDQQQQRKDRPLLNARVHGVLYTLSAADLKRLSKAEGGYALSELEVETYAGARARARTFVSGPLAKLSAEVAPTERYMRVLRAGAAAHYLDPLHQGALSGVATVPAAGLPAAYYDCPSRYLGYAFLGLAAAATGAVFF